MTDGLRFDWSAMPSRFRPQQAVVWLQAQGDGPCSCVHLQKTLHKRDWGNRGLLLATIQAMQAQAVAHLTQETP